MQETMKPLNLHDDWEDIVNANRENKEKKTLDKKRKNVLAKAKKVSLSALLFASATVLLFFIAPTWNVITSMLACISCLQIGRFLELWHT